MRVLGLILIFILLACEEPQSADHNSPVQQTDSLVTVKPDTVSEIDPHQDFLDFYTSFSRAFSNWNSDEQTLKAHFHPLHGAYVIYSTGAIPQIQRSLSPGDWKQNEAILSVLKTSCPELDIQPVFEELPEVICEENTYNKSGCFTQEINLLAESGIWNYSDLNEKEKQAIEYAAASVTITLINTHCLSFYFSKTDTGFKLSFIDIRAPCKA